MTSGTTAGDLHARATVVLPKQAFAARPSAPAPIPLSQMPIYLQRQMPGFTQQPVVTSRDAANIQEVRRHLHESASYILLADALASMP